MEKLIDKPFIVKSFISKDLVLMSQTMIEFTKRSPQVQFDDKEFMRKFVHNHFFFESMHKKIILPTLLAHMPDAPIKPSYSFLSMYFEGQGICPKHTDRGQCALTVDLCLDQKEPWSFFAEVEGKTIEYNLEVGDALILSGTDHPHWRERIQKNNFCDLAFFHFVHKDFEGGLN